MLRVVRMAGSYAVLQHQNLCQCSTIRAASARSTNLTLPLWAHSGLAMVQRSILFRWHLNVSFQRYGTARMQAQPMSAIRRFCGKTPCCWCRKRRAELRASSFLIRLFAFSAVQERSWRVCGGFGRWRRGGIHRLRRMGLVIGGGQARGCV